MLAALGKDFREQQSRLIEADASVAEMTSTAGEMQALLSWLTAAHAEESAARQAFEHQVLGSCCCPPHPHALKHLSIVPMLAAHGRHHVERI